MKRKKIELPSDPDLRGALPALRRAAKDALRLAIETGTSCYIMRDGKIVDIAAEHRAGKRRAHCRKAKKSAAG